MSPRRFGGSRPGAGPVLYWQEPRRPRAVCVNYCSRVSAWCCYGRAVSCCAALFTSWHVAARRSLDRPLAPSLASGQSREGNRTSAQLNSAL